MKEAKQIWRGLTPCFFAISAALLLKASICGSAIFFASSYEIAPWQSHILILFKLITAGLISCSLCFDLTVGMVNLQGFFGKYFQKYREAFYA